MAEISKTPKKGLSLPEHYDPSVEKLRENMALIDSLLQKANPNDLSSINDGESNINTLTTTGRYLVKQSATGCPISGYAGVVDVFRAGVYILQEWRSINSYSLEYRRCSTNSGSSWYSWTKDWNASNDGSGSGLDADMFDGLQSSSFYRKDYTSTDFNSATNEGKYRISSGTNAPYTGCSDWICLVYHLSGGSTDLYQIAMEECGYQSTSVSGGTTSSYGNTVPIIYVRKRVDSSWYSWQCLWHSGNDGYGSGLNADLLDGYHYNTLPYVPVGTYTSGSYDIDNYKTDGFYSFPTIISSKTLPTWSVSGDGYGLIVKKDARGNDGLTCCHQLLFRDGNNEIYIRNNHSDTWSDWVLVGSTANDILTKLKTVDGSGSGLDADKFEGLHGTDYVVCKKITQSSANTSALNNLLRDGLYYVEIVSTDTSGSPTGSAGHFSVTVITYGTTYSTQTAIDVATGKLYIRNRYSSSTWGSWSEVTPLIPVVSSDPTSPSEGQLWILTD